MQRHGHDKHASSIELRLPSKLGYEKVAMNTAASVANLMGFAPERVEDLKTAVAEACINAMEHGNKLDESLSVGVVLSMDETSLEVKVTDTGDGPTGITEKPQTSTRKCSKKKTPAAWACSSSRPSSTKPNGSAPHPPAATPAWSST